MENTIVDLIENLIKWKTIQTISVNALFITEV